MKIYQSITALFGAAMICSTALAQEGEEKVDKIASVNMQRLVGEYYKSAQTRDSFKQYEERLKNSDKKKVDEIEALLEEAKALRESAEGASLNAEKRTQNFREASIKNQRAEQMQKGRVAWAKQKEAAFNDKLNMELAKHREEIIAIIKEVANAEGYDFVFDRSGTSGAGVPILSYTKDATDITGVLLESINKDAPEKKEGE
ncbi:OmpH family outer membrane protein [Akkermansiaceae bacterium]|nr:OmpH family outer membrane protein [Akkermansiaceae bacterium]MDA7888396.1 OmpH family outer membrane protein [Akkermansiaceae bacterium]